MKDYFKSPPFFITIGILLLVGIIYYFSKDKYYIEYTDSSQIKIVNKWPLPRVLEEVSAIAYLDNERVACVQDEDRPAMREHHGREERGCQHPGALCGAIDLEPQRVLRLHCHPPEAWAFASGTI